MGTHVAVTVDGAPGCSIDVPATGNYETFQTVSVPLSLTAGTHVIRLTYLLDDPTVGLSIDYFEVISGGTCAYSTTVPTTATRHRQGTTATTVASRCRQGSHERRVAPRCPRPHHDTAHAQQRPPSGARLGKAQATSRLASMQSPARPGPSAPSNIGSAMNAKSSGLKRWGSDKRLLQSLLNSAPSERSSTSRDGASMARSVSPSP